MKKYLISLLFSAFVFTGNTVLANDTSSCPETLNFKKEKLAEDELVDLCKEYRGKVVMVVNTASFCGFTPQYKSLEKIYSKYKNAGFVVLGFPSNDFGQQEPSNEDQIKDFCERTYHVGFPMFEKTAVAKGTSDPMYKTLAQIAGEYPSWNFHKYLIDRNGKLVASISSQTDPSSEKVVRQIESLL